MFELSEKLKRRISQTVYGKGFSIEFQNRLLRNTLKGFNKGSEFIVSRSIGLQTTELLVTKTLHKEVNVV